MPLPFKPYGFTYVANFSAIAQGTAVSTTIQLDSGADFECQNILMAAYFGAAASFASRSNIAGIDSGNANSGNFVAENLAVMAKLARDTNTNLAQISNGMLGHLSLAFQVADKTWQSAPMRADLITSEPGRIYLPRPRVLKGQTALTITLYNNLPANVGGIATPAIDAQILLDGRKVPVGFLD